MTKIVIFGGGGYLGGKLKEIYPDAETPNIDIADPVAVRKTFDELNPEIVINAAGKTGKPNVDWCEDHKEETLRSNVTGPLVLLDECMKRGIYLAHVGSGCIYSGSKPGGYTEDDVPNFTGSFYSLTKAMSDRLLKPFPVLQLRIRMPFDGTKSPRNLLTKLIKYQHVLDEKNSLTYMPDFFSALQKLIEKKATGIYNVVNPGPVSPYEIMLRYKKEVDPAHEFQRLTLDHLSDVVKAARSNCELSGAKLAGEGIVMKPSSMAITEALQALTHC